MKYIVCRIYHKRKIFLDVPFVFPDIISHITMYEGAHTTLTMIWPEHDGHKVKCLSAGFINSIENMGECYGKSDTLGKKSRGELDTKLLRMADYGSCMWGQA